jgi:hypothetical protein
MRPADRRDAVKHVLRIILCLGIIVGAFYLSVAIWGHDRIIADTWPVDNSRVMTNVVAGFIQVFIAGLVLYIVWKPLRDSANRWVHGHFERHRALSAAARKDELADLHAKVDHIIKHAPDIPDYQKVEP